MQEIKLLSKHSRGIEQELVAFYKTIGKLCSLNSKTTEIFAFLKIYDALSQKQLGQLTGFSLGTISRTLQSFLDADIINRSMIPKTHKNIYRIKPERVDFVYTPNFRIIEDLERLDSYILEKQTELQALQRKHPIEVKFLHKRLNSLRNYAEVQRRQISREKRHSFFQEDVSEIIPLNKMIDFPFDTKGIESNIMDILGYYRDDPIRVRIRSIFFTHQSVNQQMLVNLSGFSRSTISGFLNQELKREYIRVLPREHRKPRVYYLQSISLTILSNILRTDNFIYSYTPRFQEILSKLKSEGGSERTGEDAAFLVAKIKEIIQRTEVFKNNTRFIRKAYQDLSKFLERDIQASN